MIPDVPDGHIRVCLPLRFRIASWTAPQAHLRMSKSLSRVRCAPAPWRLPKCLAQVQCLIRFSYFRDVLDP